MRNLFRKLVLSFLKSFAKRRLKNFKGRIIAVTGSVGKSSTKEAIYIVLNTKFRVRQTKKSMNSEFGLPLTILNIDSGFSSALKWSILLLKGFINSFFRMHEEILVLELGVDAPKDMDFLTSIVRPDVAIITNIAPVHMDEGQFANLEAIFNEKSKIFRKMRNGDSKKLINLDDELLAPLAKEFPKNERVTFGENEKSDFRMGEVKMSEKGISFMIFEKDEAHLVEAPVIGEFQANVILPAVICGRLWNMSYEEINIGLSRYTLPPGRMSLLDGKNSSQILDSTYNSSPVALFEALKILKKLGEKRRKIAVLGNMNELGEKSRELHEQIGEIVKNYCDILITVGAQAKNIAEKALSNGMDKEAVVILKTAEEAIEFFKDKVENNDLILAKGSQNRVRLEKLVKSLMARPEEAKKLLVRQEKDWEN